MSDVTRWRVNDPNFVDVLIRRDLPSCEAVRASAYDSLNAKIAILEAKNAELLTLLRRYRTETPLGYQPRMIAHLVDAALAEQVRT